MNAAINGTFNEIPWNATSTSTIVDFSVIDVEGTSFQIRVTGSSHVIPEFPSAIVIPLTLIAVTLIAFVLLRYRPLRESKRAVEQEQSAQAMTISKGTENEQQLEKLKVKLSQLQNKHQ